VRTPSHEPWSVFARFLSVSLGVAFVVLVVTVGIDLYHVTIAADGGTTELLLWETGPRGDRGAGTGERSLGAVTLLAMIPIVTYAGTVVSYSRHGRTAYVVIGLIQLAVLLAVAIPVLWSVLPALFR
jgi:hypothetical protein